jgi:hypothetical protein
MTCKHFSLMLVLVGLDYYTQNDLIIMHLIDWLACIQQLIPDPLEAYYRRAFTLRVTLLVLPLPAVSELPV